VGPVDRLHVRQYRRRQIRYEEPFDRQRGPAGRRVRGLALQREGQASGPSRARIACSPMQARPSMCSQVHGWSTSGRRWTGTSAPTSVRRSPPARGTRATRRRTGTASSASKDGSRSAPNVHGTSLIISTPARRFRFHAAAPGRRRLRLFMGRRGGRVALPRLSLRQRLIHREREVQRAARRRRFPRVAARRARPPGARGSRGRSVPACAEANCTRCDTLA